VGSRSAKSRTNPAQSQFQAEVTEPPSPITMSRRVAEIADALLLGWRLAALVEVLVDMRAGGDDGDNQQDRACDDRPARCWPRPADDYSDHGDVSDQRAALSRAESQSWIRCGGSADG